MTKIKMCGMRQPADIEEVNVIRPDYVGFIFAADRKRYIRPELAAQLKAQLDPKIQACGVFVNASCEEILAVMAEVDFDIIQLHGQEDERFIERLRGMTDRPIWKAFRIAGEADVEKAAASSADLVLLDTGAGGSGQTFDWSLVEQIDRPYLLAGGLDAGNVALAIEKMHPYGVDVSSGIETEGKKDPVKMHAFSQAVQDADQR